MTSRIVTSPLSTRNQVILRWIGEGGVATRQQLTRRYWSDARPRTAYRQLQRLVSSGYLLMRPWHIATRQEVIYALTPEGGWVLNAGAPHLYIDWPSHGEIDHLIRGQEVRSLLEQRLAARGGTLIQWRSERLLRHLQPPSTQPGDIPDAQMIVRPTQNGPIETVDIEIDGKYYGQMLAGKAAQYGDYTRPVLWVCEPHRAPLVGTAIQSYPNIELLVLPADGYSDRGTIDE
jgi:hypothetical protein